MPILNQKASSGGGSLPATVTVNGAGGLEINPTDDSEAAFEAYDAEGNPLFYAIAAGTQVNANGLPALVAGASGDTYVQPTLATHSAILADFVAGNSLVEVKDPGELGFFGATPVTQPAAPVTLGDVIAALKALGLVAT